jgi:hypothetical protein
VYQLLFEQAHTLLQTTILKEELQQLNVQMRWIIMPVRKVQNQPAIIVVFEYLLARLFTRDTVKMIAIPWKANISPASFAV